MIEDDDLVFPAGSPPDEKDLIIRITKLTLRDEVRRELETEYKQRLGQGIGIPRLTARSASRYIASVAAAVLRRQIDSAQANVMLYAAQLLIAAERLKIQAEHPRKLGRPPKSGTVIDAGGC